MLRFESKPDAVFPEILHAAIDVMADKLNLEENDALRAFMPRSRRFFTTAELREQLLALGKASRAMECYQPTDYHWLLLYEALEDHCDIFNDGPFGPLAEVYGIEQIEFGAVVDLFFWDIDFLNDKIADLPLERREQLAFSPETFGLSMGMKPHPEELALTLCESEDDREAVKAYLPGSKTYPDFSNA